MNTKGFTLVEVLIGLFIAVVASAYVAQTITSTNKVVAAGREVFVATNLAHEGIDLTRAMRDTTWFSITDRTKWVSESEICKGPATYTYTIDTEVVRNRRKVMSDSQQVLYIQPNKLWTHVPNSNPTAYRRVLEADCTHVNDAAGPYVTITSTVAWAGQNSGPKSVSIKEQLYNWFP